jgi:anti-sigma regulatory factor (Ser/Thr protein kinase)
VNQILSINDVSRVAELRRLAVTAAREEGLDEMLTSNAGLVATEVATNILKHASSGWVQITRLQERGWPGVEILAIDHGPGIGNMQQCLADGYSSSGTAGTGLGAISRLSHTFDAYSEPGKGTVVLSQIYAVGDRPDSGIMVGAVNRPIASEEVSGDAWAIRREGAAALVMMADGLGHGLQAAEASADAVSAFRQGHTASPSALVEQLHRALRGTRGAAVAVAFLDFAGGCVQYSGLGNIASVIAGPPKTQNLVSHYGTAGHEARKIAQFDYRISAGAVLVMHTDGVSASWSLDDHAGLNGRHPSVIAGVIFRDASRSRDDACILALRRAQP